MPNPNPNLWSVRYTSKLEPAGVTSLWILAPDAGSAERKAKRFLKRLGDQKIRIVGIKHNGTIDAF